jgi:hypothetical protein
MILKWRNAERRCQNWLNFQNHFKGHLISKWFWILPKNKLTNSSYYYDDLFSFVFGRNQSHQKSFRNFLTFTKSNDFENENDFHSIILDYLGDQILVFSFNMITFMNTDVMLIPTSNSSQSKIFLMVFFRVSWRYRFSTTKIKKVLIFKNQTQILTKLSSFNWILY